MKHDQDSNAGLAASGKRKSWWSRLIGEDDADAAEAGDPNPTVAATPAEAAAADVETPAPPPAANRRATVRLEAPLGQQDTVRFSVRGKVYESPVHDLSLGGVSFWLPRGEFALLTPGMILSRATVERGDRRFLANIEVRGTRKVKSFLGGEQLHVGCQFKALDAEAQATLEAMLGELGGGRPLK